ncbi:unnamed protein product [Parajaminaea phylloscopi]
MAPSPRHHSEDEADPWATHGFAEHAEANDEVSTDLSASALARASARAFYAGGAEDTSGLEDFRSSIYSTRDETVAGYASGGGDDGGDDDDDEIVIARETPRKATNRARRNAGRSSDDELQRQQQRVHDADAFADHPTPRRQHSSTSSADPWNVTSRSQASRDRPPSSHIESVAPISPFPTTTSAIRGGFTSSPPASSLTPGPRHGESSRPQSSLFAQLQAGSTQQSPAPPLPPPATPWDGEEISVILRPELEGIIFKYHSYTILRTPAQDTAEQDQETTSALSGQILSSTRVQRTQRRQRGEAESGQVHGRDAANKSSSTGDRTAPFGPGKTVVRRYSDFVWLNDILIRRYPFRLIPVLPPKRLTIPVAGRHLSSDDGFVERRRRGLQRYLRALCAHPTLSRDPLTRTFLTDKRSIAEWRGSNPNPSVEEEALSPHATPPPRSELSGLPTNSTMGLSSPTSSTSKELDAKLEAVAQAVPSAVEKWSNLVSLFERMARRLEAQGLDHARLASLLGALETTTGGLYRSIDSQKQPESPATSAAATASFHAQTRALVERVSETHRDLSDLHSLRATNWADSTLEHLKRQRDLWLSFSHLLSRKTQLGGDNVVALKQKVSSAKGKLASLNSTPPSNRSASHASDVESLESSLRTDSLQVEVLLRRRERIKVCLSSELQWLALNADKPRGEGVWSEWVAKEAQVAGATRTAMVECANEMDRPLSHLLG